MFYLWIFLLFAPTVINRSNYEQWLVDTHSARSAFDSNLFDWYEKQETISLPSSVWKDPDGLAIDVGGPEAETIALENSGDIEEGNTVGFSAYGVIDAPIDTVLAVELFNRGKPLHAATGETFPYDTVFGSRHEVFTGLGRDYICITTETNGGIVQDLRDRYSVLLRGNAVEGYVLFVQYFGPTGDTATQNHVSIILLKTLPDGKTDFRESVRQNGQSYKIFGLEYGRKNFGFNASRVRAGVKADVLDEVKQLKTTGIIKENKP